MMLFKRIADAGAALALAGTIATACTPASSYAGTHLFGGVVLPHIVGRYAPVVVEDHTTSGRWDVRYAVLQWNIPNTKFGTCPAQGVSCVEVYETDKELRGNSSVIGNTDRYAGTGLGASLIVMVTNSFPSTAAMREQAMCHEFGHVYGLDHDNTGGCLSADIGQGQHPYPSSQDRARIKYEYTERRSQK